MIPSYIVKTGLALGGGVVGAVASWYFTRKKLTTAFDEKLQSEMEQVKNHYRDQAERSKKYYEGLYEERIIQLKFAPHTVEKPDPSEITVSDAKGIVDAEGYRDGINKIKNRLKNPPVPVEDPDEEFAKKASAVREALENASPETQEYLEEVISKEPVQFVPALIDPSKEMREKIYLVLDDEWQEGDYDKASLVYYEEDDTLTDERDEIIHDVAYLFPKKMLNRFGENPNDPDVLLIRNELREMDLEVARDSRSYTECVLGIKSDAVLKKRPKRFRDDD